VSGPKPVLAWVNCYGAWNPNERPLLETIGYHNYLNGVADSISLFSHRLAAIYLSGGMRDNAGRTECETTAPELTRRLRTLRILERVRRDESTVTTIGIVRNFLTTARDGYLDHELLLFCDTARYQMNCYLVSYFAEQLSLELPAKPEGIVVPILRLDLHPDSAAEVQASKLQTMKEQGVEAIEAGQMKERGSHLQAPKK
jgi:hypothetical protein